MFVTEQSSGNLLLLILRSFVKFAITVQTSDNIESVRCATGHGGCKELPERRNREKIGALLCPRTVLTFSRPVRNVEPYWLFQDLCDMCMSMLQLDKRVARRMDSIPTKSQPKPQIEPTQDSLDGIELYGPAVVHWRAWLSALRVALSGAHAVPIKLSTVIEWILKTHNRSKRLLVDALIFSTRCMEFPVRRPTMKSVHLDRTICTSRNSPQFSEVKWRGDLRSSVPYWTQQHLTLVQIEDSNVIHRMKRRFQRNHEVPKMMQKQQRRQRKHIGQAARSPSC